MTVRALPVTKSVAYRTLPVAKAFLLVAVAARQCRVLSLERILRDFSVVEGADFERLGVVARIALLDRVAQTELACVFVYVAAGACTRHAPVTRATAALAIGGTGLMARSACCLCVHPLQWPRAVVDVGLFPADVRVTVCAAAFGHFGGELVAMRVGVAVCAGLLSNLEPVAGALVLVARIACNRLVFAVQCERRALMLRHTKTGRPKPVFVVARVTIAYPARAERTLVNIAMTVIAPLELQLPKASVR